MDEEEIFMDDEAFLLEHELARGRARHHKSSSAPKQKANHLLQFKYSHSPAQQAAPRRSRGRGQQPSLPFKKERFLQANYRFVAYEKGDYIENFKDPDLLLDWRKVEQVVLTTWLPQSCPICLDTFTAAKVSKCGHVFCWHCIIRHLSYGTANKFIGKCPICFETISLKELKSIVFETTKQYTPGDTIQMTLLKRSKGSVVPLPRPKWSHKTETNVATEDSSTAFAKFTLTSNILSILDRENKELEEAAKEASSCQDDSLPFILMAMDTLQERRKEFCREKEIFDAVERAIFVPQSQDTKKMIESTSPPNPLPLETKQAQEAENGLTESDFDHTQFSGTTETKSEPKQIAPLLKESGKGSKKPELVVPNSDNFFYQYQSTDGQQLFLHPLNFKMLLAECGSFDNLPDIIGGKILEIEDFTLTEMLRKRNKPLAHLPLASNVQFVEIEMRPHVSRQTANQFKDETGRRSRRRQNTKRKDQEEKRKEEEQTIFPFYHGPDLLDTKNFPSYAPTNEVVREEELPTNEVPTEEPSVTTPQPTAVQPIPISSTQTTPWGRSGVSSASPPSFAQALKSSPSISSLVTADMQVKNSKGGKQYLILSSSGRGRRR